MMVTANPPRALPWETPKGRRPTREERAETAPLPAGQRHRSPGTGATYYDRDDGCNKAPHCLTCPLPECRYDRASRLGMDEGPQAATDAILETVRILRAEGKARAAIALAVRRTPRMVNRYFRMLGGRPVY